MSILKLSIILTALYGFLVAGVRPGFAASSEDNDFWINLAALPDCVCATEDVYITKGKYTANGLYYSNLPPSPKPLTIETAVAFLKANLTDYSIWRDDIDRHVIHIVYTNALAWKSNPLNQIVSFHGTMSFMQLASNVFAKQFPNVHFYYSLPPVGPLLPTYSDLSSYKKPLHFDVKNMTLRQFLTNDLIYQHPNGGSFWQVYYYTLENGKFTGRIDIQMYGFIVGVTPATHPATQPTMQP
jgi:hypothetical protein